MATPKWFWPEIMRIWAQWMGVGIASIPAGITLGILLREGVSQPAATAFGLSVGFVFAGILWMLIGRLIGVRPVRYTMGFSSTVLSLEPACAVAAVAVLCVTISVPPQTGSVDQSSGVNPVAGHAIP